MNLPRRTLVALAAVLVSAAGAVAGPDDPFAWPAPTRTARPWTRWWWLGSAVDAPNLDRQLAGFHDAGLGGVEICPIYGAKGYEARFIGFLSPKWMDMLAVTTKEAARLGMGVDMTTGDGWPMGGPWVSPEHASESVSVRRFPLGTDGKIPDVTGIAYPDKEEAAARNEAALNGILPGSAGPDRLLCLRAVGPEGSQVDLTDRVQGGRLDWRAPGAGWSLYSLTATQPVQRVKRAAPGGQGNVVDPYSVQALDSYLSRFDQAFRGYGGAMPRAQFQDSFEYMGANWTPGFLAEFARRRGYDLRAHLPELFGAGSADGAARVREDYRRTIAELHLAFVGRWTSWSHAHGSLTREQAHGAPANIEDVYAAADIPETEGSFGTQGDDQVPMLKFASSAAHVTGRTLASSETFTWLGEHFQVPLSQLKPAADTFFLSGVNHIFLHGIPYSPADAPWPGWLFYASVNFGPEGGLWHDFPAFAAYATRCQSILQSGKPDNDVLLYFPVADFWQQTQARGGRGFVDPLVLPFTTPGKWMLGTPFHDAAMELWRTGVGYDEVTDGLLEGARVVRAPGGQGQRISLGGNLYRAIVLPPLRFLTPGTLRRLLALARDGATIVFAGALPADVPGFSDPEARREEYRRLTAGIAFRTRPDGTLAATVGLGQVLSGCASPSPASGILSHLMVSAGIPRERMSDCGLMCIRRQRDDGFDYLIVNRGNESVERWVPLARVALAVVILDPLYPDRAGRAALRPDGDGSAVFLQMAPGQSLILRTFASGAPAGPAWRYLRPAKAAPLVLAGEWSVHFVEGGPALPHDFRSPRLASWTERDDPEAKRFAGTAVYSLRFMLPSDPRSAGDWTLDLGRVADSARVRLNGRDVATLWCDPFRVEVGRFLKAGDNLLEVEVTNLAANRIRDLDLRHVSWKNFYEINFVNRKYKPFDASTWPLRDSGLLGPVVLAPMEMMTP
jgi:hypothetical protein